MFKGAVFHFRPVAKGPRGGRSLASICPSNRGRPAAYSYDVITTYAERFGYVLDQGSCKRNRGRGQVILLGARDSLSPETIDGEADHNSCRASVSRKNKFANNLLYRPKDGVFSIMGGNWLRGQTTPIHDHLTWAIVGVSQREERESIYRRIDHGSDPKRARLELAIERINEQGQVTVLGRTGIRQVDNVSLAPSLSVHMYGLDIGTLERHSYDPNTGEIGKFVSGYCNVLRDEGED